MVNNKKFLDSDGLRVLWKKIVDTFAKKGELDANLFKVVTELPEEGRENKVYLVLNKNSQDGQNQYTEYIYLNDDWEKIGEYQSEVELTTEATKVNKDIPVAGGPLADLCNKQGITSIKADTNLQDLLMTLFAKELWPTPTFTEGVVKSFLPAVTFSLNNSASIVEVGTPITASGCAAQMNIYPMSGQVCDRMYKGIDYGYSSANNNKKEIENTTIHIAPKNVTRSGAYGLVRTINGKSEPAVSGEDMSAVKLNATTFEAVEGENTVKVENTAAKVSATFAAIQTAYPCSNFGNTKAELTIGKDAATITESQQPVNSATKTFIGAYPFFASTAQIGTLTKQALQTSKEYNVVLVAESDTAKHSFAIPASKSVASIQMLNTLSGKYEAYDISKFTKSTQQMTVGGKSVDYTVYTRNDGKNGSATFKITLA